MKNICSLYSKKLLFYHSGSPSPSPPSPGKNINFEVEGKILFSVNICHNKVEQTFVETCKIPHPSSNKDFIRSV